VLLERIVRKQGTPGKREHGIHSLVEDILLGALELELEAEAILVEYTQ
jgi:hypothetical protein